MNPPILRTDEIIKNFLNSKRFKDEDSILISVGELKDYISEVVKEYNGANVRLRKALALKLHLV